jgi:hypothetical protein
MSDDITQRIQLAKERLETAQRSVIEHNTQLRLATEELERVTAEMQEKFGVATLDEAREKLAQIDAKIIEKLDELTKEL